MTLEDKSKLVDALQQRDRSKFMKPLAISPSKSTPYQRRRPSIAPTPTRNPSMTLRRRPAKPSDLKLLPRLEEENASLPQQNSVDFILAQIDRQNAMLDEDPKAVCIQSNELKAHLSTMQNLVTDSSTEKDDIDWEFWSAMTEDFAGVALKLPHLVSQRLRAGIPPKVRGVIWQAMSQSASLNLETMYGQLVAEHSPYERIIQRDLARTFPHVDMFKQEGGDGQRSLERILKAYSLYDSLVGYCQGLAFLVGPLLMNMSEQQSFCVFVRLMETYEMRTMFTLNMEGLQLRLYQFSSLFAQILPELSDHLADHTVNAPMYASQWFLTLFAYAFPIPLIFRIYDIVFAEGAAETIMRVAIAMLKRSEEKILKMTEFEDILDYVTTKLYDPYNDDPGKVISDAMELSGLITKEKIDHLADLYVRELEEEKKQTEQVLAVRFNFWSKQEPCDDSGKKKKRESGSWLSSKRASATGDDQVPSSPVQQQYPSQTEAPPISSSQDVAMLHQQIEELLLALSQQQNDHIQLKQELMQVKMDKMDVEAERDALQMTMEEMPRPTTKRRGSNENAQAELTKVKNDNFELRQQVEELVHQNDMAKDAQNTLVEKIVELKHKNNELEDEKQRMTKELKPMQQRLSDSEKVAQELQLDKIRLLHDLEQARDRNPDRRRPTSMYIDRSNQKDDRRQSTATIPNVRSSSAAWSTTRPTSRRSMDPGEPATESRCRELEQMLADAKLRIAELETAQPLTKRVQRNSTPASPTRTVRAKSYTGHEPVLPTDVAHKHRRSFDPISTPRIPQDLSKRSSFYGRFWSVISSQDTPPSSPVKETLTQ
ncbi:hypothetical protein DFQ28_008108 [Apophysomyces sp. BC1034]|nr:hypothetical protein DFQ30_006936 [Apophysomyces sp. BC1015]KAG0181516.1 hypothetical protein DFQ29_008072 [Apophysomyces sp. BC1021]KAG0192718.1 hypothetical protein DFQ28_008108 [Apophysomyces sp. BC1034]